MDNFAHYAKTCPDMTFEQLRHCLTLDATHVKAKFNEETNLIKKGEYFMKHCEILDNRLELPN